jgi:hypothetical protein
MAGNVELWHGIDDVEKVVLTVGLSDISKTPCR